jgi:hypothetical protein
MDYLIGISDDKSFVIVNLKKTVPSTYVLIFTKESVRLAKKFGINSFLFDIRTIDNTWGTLEKYTFAKELEKFDRKRHDRVALLVASMNKTHDFIETVTRNQGFNTRIFTRHNDAVDWLKQ